MRSFFGFISCVFVFLMSSASVQAQLHAFGGDDGIENIDLHVFYYLPKDTTPLADWRDRVGYHAARVEKFHQREFNGLSMLDVTIHEQPFVSGSNAAEFPAGDVNNFYWHIVNEVWHSGAAVFKPGHFPIILVFSHNNFSPGYDNWTREGVLQDEAHTPCPGHVNGEGEDRPGSACGGSRAIYWNEKNIGLSLVTADGWLVPIKGTDCVAYHEGVGHAIGLPHPEPADDSVMSMAQYVDSLQVSWINEDQKQKMGWEPQPIDKSGLFSTFSVTHDPKKPQADQPVVVTAQYPARFKLRTAKLEYQTALDEPFQPVEEMQLAQEEEVVLLRWKMPSLSTGQGAAYRVRVEMQSGETEEIWNYYRIRE